MRIDMLGFERLRYSYWGFVATWKFSVLSSEKFRNLSQGSLERVRPGYPTLEGLWISWKFSAWAKLRLDPSCPFPLSFLASLVQITVSQIFQSGRHKTESLAMDFIGNVGGSWGKRTRRWKRTKNSKWAWRLNWRSNYLLKNSNWFIFFNINEM